MSRVLTTKTNGGVVEVTEAKLDDRLTRRRFVFAWRTHPSCAPQLELRFVYTDARVSTRHKWRAQSIVQGAHDLLTIPSDNSIAAAALLAGARGLSVRFASSPGLEFPTAGYKLAQTDAHDSTDPRCDCEDCHADAITDSEDTGEELDNAGD